MTSSPAAAPEYVPRLIPLGKDAPALLATGNGYYQNGLWEDAILSYHEALKLDPSQALAHLFSAKCLFQLRRVDEAEAACHNALRLNPELPEALLLLGHLAVRRENWTEAAAYYSRSLTVDTSQAMAHAMLGHVRRKLGDLSAAQGCYQAALKLDSQQSFWWISLTEICFESGDLDTSAFAARQALELNPLLPQAHYQLGLVHQKRREGSEAEHCFAQAARCNSAATLGLMAKARHLARTGGYPAAGPILEPLLAKYPRWPQPLIVLGEARLRDQDTEAALQAFQTARDLNPSLAEPYYQMGRVYLELNRTADAMAAFESACQRGPAMSPAHFALAELYGREGRTAERDRQLRHALADSIL